MTRALRGVSGKTLSIMPRTYIRFSWPHLPRPSYDIEFGDYAIKLPADYEIGAPGQFTRNE